MNNERKNKLQKVIRVIVSRFVTEELPDNENNFGLINISEVVLSPDGTYLDIKVSCFKNPELLTKTLAKYAHIIQRHIGKQVQIRVNPRVRFRYDETGEVGQNITNKINTLSIEDIEKKLEQ